MVEELEVDGFAGEHDGVGAVEALGSPGDEQDFVVEPIVRSRWIGRG